MKLYTATWCEPCNELKQWLKDNHVKIDIEEVDDMAKLTRENMGIYSVPTLVDDEGNLLVGREQIKPHIEALLK